MKYVTIFFWLILASVLCPQGLGTGLNTNNLLSKGQLIYFEKVDSSKLEGRYNVLSTSKFSITSDKLDIAIDDLSATVSINNAMQLICYIDIPQLKGLDEKEDIDLVLYANDQKLVSSTAKTVDTYSKFDIDIKPSIDLNEPQKLDIKFDRSFSSRFNFTSRAYFSSKVDSNALNSIQLGTSYSIVIPNLNKFKYLGISGKITSEHPQDFSETNLAGSIVLSSIIPFTDQIARIPTNNNSNASIGLLVQPELQFVKNTVISDSSFGRFTLHGAWDIPLFTGQYARFYAVAYFQDKFKPRSYIEMTIEQEVTETIAFIVKWINGELAPTFSREVSLNVGIRLMQ